MKLQTLSEFLTLSAKKFPSRVTSDFFEMLKTHLRSKDQLVLAISTGADSMTLACLVARWRKSQNFPLQNLHFLHCNHKIRPESEEESAFFSLFFAWYKMQIFTKPAEIPNDENSLRNWRYACFKKTCTTDEKILLTGHHLNDHIETTFLNLMRGCTLEGFINMQYVWEINEMKILRPLLPISKQQIFDFCNEFSVPYFTDVTNFDSKTSKRNRLRNEVLQNFQNTNFEQSFKNLYNALPSEQKISQIYNTLPTHPTRKASFALQTTVPTTATQLVHLRKELKLTHNLRSTQINERISWFSTSSSWRKMLGNTYFFIQTEKNKKKLTIIQIPKNTLQNWKKTFRNHYLSQNAVISSLWMINIAGCDVLITKKERLGATLRYPQPYDTFSGKTRNRRCLNQKIPLFWRNFIPVIVKEGKILHMFKEVMH